MHGPHYGLALDDKITFEIKSEKRRRYHKKAKQTNMEYSWKTKKLCY